MSWNIRVNDMRRICMGIVLVSTLLSAWFQTTLLFSKSGLILKSSSSISSPPRALLSSSVRIGKASLVPRGEFWEKRPSREIIDEAFTFQRPSNKDLQERFQRQLHQYWSCSSNKDSRKLAFLHVRRSGGSLIQALLRGYSTLCHAGIAIVTQCFDVGLPYLQGKSYWTNAGVHSPHPGSECILRYIQERNETLDVAESMKRQQKNNPQPVTTNLLQRKQIDIVGGQLPLGIDAFWNSTQQQNPTQNDMRYIIMIRDPLARYVSQFVHDAKKKTWTVADTLEALSESVYDRLQTGQFYETLSNTLITPKQRNWAEREHIRWTMERRVNTSMSNLAELPVLVGRLDRLPDTIRLIQHMIDPERRLGSGYDFYSSPERIKSIQGGGSPALRSKSQDIFEAIRTNATLHRACQEFLKYEYQIYSFAMHVHQVQLEVIDSKIIAQ